MQEVVLTLLQMYLVIGAGLLVLSLGWDWRDTLRVCRKYGVSTFVISCCVLLFLWPLPFCMRWRIFLEEKRRRRERDRWWEEYRRAQKQND